MVETDTKNEASAVIESGGKQYLVRVGDELNLELLGKHEAGDQIKFDRVLMSDNGKETTLGGPYIEGAKVTATFVGEIKGPKLTIIRYKAKSNRDRKLGHRQKYSRVKIDSLV